MEIIIFIILIVILAIEAESGFKRTKKLFKNPVKVKDHPLIIWLGVFVFLVSSIFTISGWGLNFLDRADNWLFYKEHQYETLRSLHTEADIDYFKEKLGTPVFINENGKNTNIEYIFVNKDYYCQVVATNKEKVLFYSVTSRAQDFNPTYKAQGGITVALNKTRFSEIQEKPWDIYVFAGARRYFYNELYYMGNPGLYQTYLFSDNDASENLQFTYSLISYGFDKIPVTEHFDQNNNKIIGFRNDNIINTYGVFAPDFIVGYMLLNKDDKTYLNDWAINKLGFYMGVNLDQVRLLNQ